MSADTQAKLLRVLQEHEVERLGGDSAVKVDVRVIAATNRDLQQSVARGTFREDLYYRLNVFPLRAPALRERQEDIPLLVHHFLARYASKLGRQIAHIPSQIMDRLLEYSWPGNVRELENVIQRAVIVSNGPDLRLAVESLSPSVAVAPAQNGRLRSAEHPSARTRRTLSQRLWMRSNAITFSIFSGERHGASKAVLGPLMLSI